MRFRVALEDNGQEWSEEKTIKSLSPKPLRKRARGALHEETFYSFDDKKLLESYGGKECI